MPPKISVIIPTRDEQEGIAKVIQETRVALGAIEHEIIVVDASHDDTPTFAVRAGARLVKQVGNGGVGEALIQGFYWARGEYIVFFDGDWTYDPNDVLVLIQPLLSDEADLVNGNRFANMEDGAMPVSNKIGNYLLTWLGNMLFHTSISDSQSGMKAFRKSLLTQVTLWERDFPMCSELLAEASKQNMRIVEVGIKYRRRIGKSKLQARSAGPRILWASLKMMIDYDPFFLCLEIGLVLEALALVIAWPVIVDFIEFNVFRLIGRTLLATFCSLAGVLSIFTGVILNAFSYSVKKIEARLDASRQ